MLTLTMFNVLTRCLGFLYKIYLSRVLSTTELGIYSLTTSIYMVIITFVGSSIPLTISKITSNNLALNRTDKTKYSVTSSLCLSIGISIFVSILLVLCKPLLTLVIGNNLGYSIMLVLIPSIIFTAIYSQIRGYLWGIENYFAVSIVELVEQILRIAFCMLLITIGLSKFNSISVGLALSIACAISTIYGIYLYIKNGGKFAYKPGYFKEIIQSSLPLTGVRLFGSLLQPIVAIILPLILTNLGMLKADALSELGIVMGMSMPLLSIPSTIIGSLCMILIPKISSHTNSESIKNQISSYVKFTISCIFVFIPIFIVLGEPVCNLVFSNSSAGIYMSYCAWTIIPMGIAQITTSILNALNQEKKTFYYFVISSIIMIASIFILPRFLGIQSMIVANGLSSIILSLLNIIQIKKITNHNYNIMINIISHILVSFPVILLTKLTYNWISSFLLNTFFSIAITSILAFVGYIALLIVFNIIDMSIIRSYYSKYTKKQSKIHN